MTVKTAFFTTQVEEVNNKSNLIDKFLPSR